MKWDLRFPLQANKSVGKVNALKLVITSRSAVPFPNHKPQAAKPT